MALFFWKKNKLIDTFANSLANELFSNVQPEPIKDYFNGASKDKKAKKNRKFVDQSLEDIIKQVQQFRMTHTLGVYGKARLQLKLNERLTELGYDKKIVDKLNEIILVRAAN